MVVTSPMTNSLSVWGHRVRCWLLVGVMLIGGALAPAAAEPASAEADLAHLSELVAARPDLGPEPTRDETRAWWDRQSGLIIAAATEFLATYPQDPRRWLVTSYYLRSSLHATDVAVRESRMQRAHELADEALVAPDISDEDWQQVVEWKFYRRLHDPASHADGAKSLAPLRELLDELTRRVPQTPRLRGLEGQYIEALLRHDEAAAEALLARLVESENEAVAGQARGMRQMRALRTTPVELKFTAIDGREVDLAAMRGKVVLVDFWATWCGPCIAEMPNVKRVYDEYHDQGFEVVGITLDRVADLDKVKADIVRLEMPWPQFIDRENRRNRFADELGIIAIPAPLLFDQQGLLVTERARGERLEQEVRRLLQR